MTDDVTAWLFALAGPAGHPPSLHAVSARARSTAAVLAATTGPGHTSAPGLATIAAALNVSQRSGANYLEELEAAGWIARCPGTVGGRINYLLTWPIGALVSDLERTADDLA